MSYVCCLCCEQVSNKERKYTLNDDLSVVPREYSENMNSAIHNRSVKIIEGIEILIGCKICKTNEETRSVCSQCYRKIENFIDFRSQILSALTPFICLESSMHSMMCNEITESPTNDEVQGSQVFSEHSSLDGYPNLPVNDDAVLNNEEIPGLDNSNDSVASSTILYSTTVDNIESDIDVCSGVDDEILELDTQCRRNEIIQIGSSSESDIEVCDYQPNRKRIKDNAVSSSVFF